MHRPVEFGFFGLAGSVVAAVVFILIMSLVREPARRNYNAVFVAGASGAYLAGGFGVWELAYVAVAGGVVSYLGLRSYRWIGLAWLMHTGWDVMHHLYGHPIWPFMPGSSLGCAILDALIAAWFFAGAPSVFEFPWSQRAGLTTVTATELPHQ